MVATGSMSRLSDMKIKLCGKMIKNDLTVKILLLKWQALFDMKRFFGKFSDILEGN
jgi:hypothetical protein